MVTRGRPVSSPIRQNIVEILYFLKKGYGYQIHKIYTKLFPSCTSEVIYYHLKKGLSTGEFTLVEIKSESGDFSWGNNVEKSYYALGKTANAKINLKVKEYIEKNYPI
jgi:hypothetical protein